MNYTRSRRAALCARSYMKSTDPVAEELRRYDEHLRDVCGLADETRRNRIRVARWFLREHFTGCAVEIATLRPDDVRRFLGHRLDVLRLLKPHPHLRRRTSRI